jgi:RNA polymerase sigma-70 factor (ECF subfamily)
VGGLPRAVCDFAVTVLVTDFVNDSIFELCHRLVPLITTLYSEDDQRMIRLQGGDAQAFNEIVAEWQGPLFGFFLRNTRDEHLSEDLVQETLLRLYRNSWDYLPRGLFKGFLFRIARNLLIDQSRRGVNDVLIRRIQCRSSGGHGDDLDLMQQVPDDLCSPENRAVEREIATAVGELLFQLPEEQRQTFLLHHYDSLTLSEVADAMVTSLPTAKSRLRLAKEKLRNLLVCRGFSEEMFSETQ